MTNRTRTWQWHSFCTMHRQLFPGAFPPCTVDLPSCCQTFSSSLANVLCCLFVMCIVQGDRNLARYTLFNYGSNEAGLQKVASWNSLGATFSDRLTEEPGTKYKVERGSKVQK